MCTVKYTKEENFICLEDLRGTSAELTLVHMGKENCKPYHAFSGIRDEYIIHFILSGRGFYSADGHTWPLGKNQMFLIYPNTEIVYCADRLEPWSYCWIGIKGSKTESVLKHCGFSKNRLVLSAPAPDQYLSCFEELFEHITLEYYDSLYRDSLLVKILSVLCRHHSQLAPDDTYRRNTCDDNVYVRQAIDYINENHMRNIGVSDIAIHIGISRTHLNHVFREELHVSVQQFLIDFRMHKAANLLSNTSMSVKEVSRNTGYNDPVVFSKAFKKKFGISPKSYRTYKDELEIRKQRP